MIERKLVHQSEDFRKYAPEEFVDKNGIIKIIQECEELIDGRWEGFVSVKIKK